MKGLIVLHNNYSYTGSILDNLPHGYGEYQFTNGDKYVGHSKFGRLEGFGTYSYKSGAKHIGYFSYGKIHGIGTFEDAKSICKGVWRFNLKHGSFYRTNKDNFVSYQQTWIKGKLVKGTPTQYIQPEALVTYKNNPKKSKPQYQSQYRGVDKKCIACCEASVNATNNLCGHVVLCHECLGRCDSCPICRAPIQQIIKLYVS